MQYKKPWSLAGVFNLWLNTPFINQCRAIISFVMSLSKEDLSLLISTMKLRQSSVFLLLQQ